MKRLLNNWNLKLTSLVLAVALWSHVHGQINPPESATFRVPLQVQPPRGLHLESDLPATVAVTVRAPRQTLRDLRPAALAVPLANPLSNPLSNSLVPGEQTLLTGGKITARLDFHDEHSGEQSAAVKAESSLPEVEIIKVNPDEIPVTLTRQTRR